jgi:diketogulonate reductase-like aldo/keto reductase
MTIAKRHGRTNAQVLLRWAIQHGLVVIPKSAHPDRIAENARIFDFELTKEEVSELNGLHDGFRSSWDPTKVP